MTTLCEHGCGTELRERYRDYIEMDMSTVHTPERCQKATRARREREREHNVAVALAGSHAALRVDLEAATAKLAEAERERDDALMALRTSRAAVESLTKIVAGLTPPEAVARAERFRAALEWYADVDNYSRYSGAPYDSGPDMGKRARAALAADPAPEAGKLQPGEARIGSKCDKGCGRNVDHFIAGVMQPTCITCHCAAKTEKEGL